MIETLFPQTANVGDVVAPDVARRIRTRISGYTRFALFDRGSYEIAPFEGEDLRELCHLASDSIGDGFVVKHARALRLRGGDYLLTRHDEPCEDLLELVFDLSPAPVANAEIHYRRRGSVFLRVPCAPGSLAIVERTPAIACNHTYVSKRLPDAEVVRLIVQGTLLR